MKRYRYLGIKFYMKNDESYVELEVYDSKIKTKVKFKQRTSDIYEIENDLIPLFDKFIEKMDV